MLVELVNRILQLGAPHIHEAGELEYSDRPLNLITPPIPASVQCSTLQGLVDLYEAQMDNVSDDVLVHITSPTTVELISQIADDYGRRRVWASARYPEVRGFQFGTWIDPEAFIIGAQQSFQRAKIERDDGSFMRDLDYVLQVASSISADQTAKHEDDGIAQRVTVTKGISLKEETVLKPLVMLAPYRTFAEIDQVISPFVFRVRPVGNFIQLALFEGDGGRWKISAAAAIKAWLEDKLSDVSIIS